jgi:HK97 family phage prohead protease
VGIFAFRERIAKGAFSNAIKSDDVRALFNHDPNYLLGRSGNKTLWLTADNIGLRYEATPPKTQSAADVRELIRTGYVSGSSFAFTVGPDDDTWDDSELSKGKLPLRTINRVRKLLDVSPVTYPAYDGTDADARTGVSMREKTDGLATRLPHGYKRILAKMERGLCCARCGQHVGLGWVTRGASAMHVMCAELDDMAQERRDLVARVEGKTPAAQARLRAARAALAAAKRRHL